MKLFFSGCCALMLLITLPLFSFYEGIPAELHAHIVTQIVKSETIEEATESLRSLAQVNKYFNNFINDPKMTQYLLSLLSKQFPDEDIETIVYSLGTKGAHDYITRHKLLGDDFVALLRRFGPEPLWQDAVLEGDLLKMKYLLLNNEYLINFRMKNGFTALHYAVRSGYPEIVAWLLQKGGGVNQKNNFGEVPLSLAIGLLKNKKGTAKKIMKILLVHGANPNVIVKHENKKMNALRMAVLENDIDAVKLLLEYGAVDKQAKKYAQSGEIRKLLEYAALSKSETKCIVQ